MTPLVRSEARKILATRRTMAVFCFALLVVVGVGTAASVQSSNDSLLPVDADALRDAISTGAGGAVIFALVLGILVVTWEYRHRTMTHTLVSTPRRERVVGAKALAALACGLLLAGVAVVLTLAIAVPWLGAGSELGEGEVWALAGRLLFAAALWSLLGVAVGALVASQVGALVSSLLWLLVAEPIVFALWTDGGRYLPSVALRGVVDSGGEDVLSFAAAAGVTVGYVVILGAAGLVATLGRDVD